MKDTLTRLVILILILVFPMSLFSESDGQRATKAVAGLSENDLVKLENVHSEEDKMNLRPQLSSLFKDPKPNLLQGAEIHLLKTDAKTYSGNGSNGFREVTYIYEMDFLSGKRHQVSVTIRHAENGQLDFALASQPVQLEKSMGPLAYGLKQLMRWGFLFLSLAIPIFMLTMFFVCFRRKSPGRLLWALFILMGIVRFDLDWTTVSLHVLPFEIIFLGFKLKHGSPYDPWILSISLPLGAILFYFIKIRQKPRRGVSSV